jgi:restriction system protein
MLSDGKERTTSDLPDILLSSKYFTLTSDELAEQKVSGGSLYHDRIWWGTTYLRQGKFIHRPHRGKIQITQKGLDLLKTHPTNLTIEWLKKDPDYSSYTPLKQKNNSDINTNKIKDLTPNDYIEIGFARVQESFKKDLLDKLHETNPYFFEKLVLDLFKKMGYGDCEGTAKSHDGGIDGIINQDKLGIEKIYIQAKRYQNNNIVREPEIRNFIGAMSGDVSKGIFVTTSSFDSFAIKKAQEDRNHKIILIDGDKLVSLMIEYNIGVQVKNIYEIKEVDEDFFETD